MKIIINDYKGEENIFSVDFEDVTSESQEEENKQIGFPIKHLIGKLKLNDEVLYETKTQEISGCSYSRADGHQKLVKDCLNYFVDNYIR